MSEPAPAAATASPPASAAGPEDAALGLSCSDRWFLNTLCGLVLALIVLHLLRMSWRGAEIIEIVRLPERRLEFQVDVNSATWVEWMQLPEIGETLARQIVADREARGPFFSPEDVARVRGIGPATMENIRPYLKLTGSRAESPGR
jgi:competence protein ComEA